MKRLDQRGAMLVIATFFAIFAVAILYTLVGVAETLFIRERLQDAADATALSGAIAHARSMNFLVLVNIVMAALMAILVTIKLVEGVAIVGIAIAAALAWPTAGASLAAIPPLKAAQANMQELYSSLEGPIGNALSALNTTSDAMADLTPGAASLLAGAEVARFAPVVSGGFAAGAAERLPVEDGEFDELCGRAGRVPIQIAEVAVSGLVGDAGGSIVGLLEEPMAAMAQSFSTWFCGEGGDGPPPYRHRYKRAYPRTEALDACESSVPEVASGTSGALPATEACLESERFEADAKPHPTTGACPDGRDCSRQGAYETRAELARAQCNPELAPAPVKYTYQERRGTVPYVWVRDHWERGDASYRTPALVVDSRRPPCGPASVDPLIVGYEPTSRSGDGAQELRPVCTDERPPPLPAALANGTILPVDVHEITRIFTCVRDEIVDVQVSGGDRVEGGDDRAPKRVLSDHELGDEAFQVRALVYSEARSGAEPAVRLARFGSAEVESELEPLRWLGDLGVAQAEYYFDGDVARAEWMWSMRWRARLRHFRSPEDPEVFGSMCALSLGDETCARAVSFVTRFGDAVLH